VEITTNRVHDKIKKNKKNWNPKFAIGNYMKTLMRTTTTSIG
jgi:hypothetical protein